MKKMTKQTARLLMALGLLALLVGGFATPTAQAQSGGVPTVDGRFTDDNELTRHHRDTDKTPRNRQQANLGPILIEGNKKDE